MKYEEPTGEFKLFKIKYGDVPEELGDRLGAALLYLGATNQKIDAGFKMLGEKQDKMLEKQDRMLQKQENTIGAIRNVSEKIDHGKEDIVTGIKSLSQPFSFRKRKALAEKKKTL